MISSNNMIQTCRPRGANAASIQNMYFLNRGQIWRRWRTKCWQTSIYSQCPVQSHATVLLYLCTRADTGLVNDWAKKKKRVERRKAADNWSMPHVQMLPRSPHSSDPSPTRALKNNHGNQNKQGWWTLYLNLCERTERQREPHCGWMELIISPAPFHRYTQKHTDPKERCRESFYSIYKSQKIT